MSRKFRRSYGPLAGVRGATRAVNLRGDTEILTGDLDGEPATIDASLIREVRHGVEILVGDGANTERAIVVREEDHVHVWYRGRIHRLRIVPQRSSDDAGQAEFDLADDATSPMTGVLLRVDVAVGEAVSTGQPLFVVEAMKMEFVVDAPRDGVVESVGGAAGDRVDIGQSIVTFVREAAPPEEPVA